MLKMSKARSSLLCVSIVLAGACALCGSAAASEQVVCNNDAPSGNDLDLCWGGATGLEVFFAEGTEGLLASSTIASTVTGSEVKIECSGGSASGSIEGAEAGDVVTAKDKFTGCKVAQPAGCGISEALETTNMEGLFSLSGGAIDEKFTGEGAGKEIASITITTCLVAGTYTLSGSQTCTVLSAESSALTHTEDCLKSQSALKLGSETASFKSRDTLETGSDIVISPYS